jgi:hypothetical protein
MRTEGIENSLAPVVDLAFGKRHVFRFPAAKAGRNPPPSF